MTEVNTTHQIQEFEMLASNWSHSLSSQDLVLLEGEMGAGKTLWVRRVVEQLGGKWVMSPSFAIIQRYPTKTVAVDHVDLYRMKDMNDLDSTGFWDLFDQESALIFVEWSDLIDPILWPKNFTIWKIKIEFVQGQPDARQVTIRKGVS